MQDDKATISFRLLMTLGLLLTAFPLNAQRFDSPLPPLDQPTFTQSDVDAWLNEPSVVNIQWQVVELDGDSEREITMRQYSINNWQCETYTHITLDYDSAARIYVRIGEDQFIAPTRACAWIHAEAAMWDGDYAAAVEQYELASELPVYTGAYLPDAMFPYVLPIPQLDTYFHARWALANILTGRTDAAKSILDRLDMPPLDDFYGYGGQPLGVSAEWRFVQALRTYVDDSALACIASFNVFAELALPVHRLSQARLYGTTQTIVPTHLEPVSLVYSPARIGCDAPSLIESWLEDTVFTTAQPPQGMLREAGLGIRRHVLSDMDADGATEHLIWLNVLVPPILFVPQGDRYQVSRPSIDPYREKTFHFVDMPNGAGRALVYLTDVLPTREPWACFYDEVCGVGGGGEYCEERGVTLNIWVMHDGELLNALSRLVCERLLSTLIPNARLPDLIQAGQVTVADFSTGQIYDQPLEYRWDSVERTYMRVIYPFPASSEKDET